MDQGPRHQGPAEPAAPTAEPDTGPSQAGPPAFRPEPSGASCRAGGRGPSGAVGSLRLLAIRCHGGTEQGPPGSSGGGVCCCLARPAVVIEGAGCIATGGTGGIRGAPVRAAREPADGAPRPSRGVLRGDGAGRGCERRSSCCRKAGLNFGREWGSWGKSVGVALAGGRRAATQVRGALGGERSPSTRRRGKGDAPVRTWCAVFTVGPLTRNPPRPPLRAGPCPGPGSRAHRPRRRGGLCPPSWSLREEDALPREQGVRQGEAREQQAGSLCRCPFRRAPGGRRGSRCPSHSTAARGPRSGGGAGARGAPPAPRGLHLGHVGPRLPPLAS